MCSKKECEIAIEALQPLKKNIVVGLHLKSKGLLPSGEKFIDVANYISKFDLSGITASCVNPDEYDFIKNDISKGSYFSYHAQIHPDLICFCKKFNEILMGKMKKYLGKNPKFRKENGKKNLGKKIQKINRQPMKSKQYY